MKDCMLDNEKELDSKRIHISNGTVHQLKVWQHVDGFF